jgi:hypothetical protein
MAVFAEQHRVGGQLGQVEPAHRLGLGVKRRVGRPVEPAADPMWFDVERGQDPPDLRGADLHRFVQALSQ